METRTQLNGVRLAPRKVRAVADLIKKKDLSAAIDQLSHLIRKPAPTLEKLLKSALANAENNFHMVADNLYVKNILVDEGIKLKRFMPRAQGRATEIQKKTSRITVILDERVAGLKRSAQTAKPKETAEHAGETAEAMQEKTVKPKIEMKREVGKKAGLIGGVKRMFQRKSV